MGGMRKLGNEHRRGGVLEAETETNDRPSYREHDKAVGKGLKEHSDDDDYRADDDGVFAPDLLNKPPEEELRNDTTEALRAIEDTQCGSSRVVEVSMSVSILDCRSKGPNGLVPVCQRLHAVHDRAI